MRLYLIFSDWCSSHVRATLSFCRGYGDADSRVVHGSDESGRVAAGIERAIERMDERTADNSDIEDLRALLQLESENNWRQFLLGLIGTIHYDLEEIDSARTILEESIPLTRSMRRPSTKS